MSFPPAQQTDNHTVLDIEMTDTVESVITEVEGANTNNTNNNNTNNTHPTNNTNNTNNTNDGASQAATAQNTTAAEEPKKEEISGQATWVMKNFSKVRTTERKYYGEPIEILGMKWNILLFPNGNDVDQLSIYLNVPEPRSLPQGWSRNISFSLEVVCQTDPRLSIRREATHRFTELEVDWGFTQFMQLVKLLDPRSGFIKDDKMIVNIEIEKLPEPQYPGSMYSYWNYDSKKETGYVGLQNQGATCYMNSLLQAFYHVGAFRKAVYSLPTENDLPTESIPLALQRIYYRLQFGDQSVGTKELTKSFGWTRVDSFTQHDVQELNRVLCDNLQGKMKGSKAEGTIERLLQGKIKNFIKCINVNYESTRTEEFFDLSLNVKGCKTLIESFEKYVETENLDGDNKYQAEGHGLQAARKGCVFMTFPPILHLQLKRFEYDPMKDAMVKVNDRYEFPEVLELDRFLAEDADKSIPQRYHLHGVLVHSGDVHGGHYYAFIKPTMKTEWFKFDDERVSKATIQQVSSDNFGGEEEYNYKFQGRTLTSIHKKYANAYMLVYYRESDVEELLTPTLETDIAPHLKERFSNEEAVEENKRKEKAEAHLFTSVKLVAEEDLKNWRKLDLIKFEGTGLPIKEFKVKKTSNLKELRKTLSEHYGVPSERMRFWTWVSRQNKTLRPDSILSGEEEEKKIEDLLKGDVRLYLEFSTLPPSTPLDTPPFPTLHEDDVFLFFKYYDPEREALTLLGQTYVKSFSKPPDLVPIALRMLGLPFDTKLIMFEEVKPSMVDPLKMAQTLKEGEISSGDIVVFQKALFANGPQYSLPSVIDFYDYVLNRVTVKFRKLEKPKIQAFTLELSKRMYYDQVTKKIAEKLGTDPLKIRLTGHNGYYDQPKPTPIKRNERMTLQDMLAVYYQPPNANNLSDTLFFEALELPVSEYENKKVLKITWHNLRTDAVETHQLLVPKDATIGFILEELKKIPSVKLEGPVSPGGPAVLGVPGSGQIRLLEVWNGKMHKILREEEPISNINDYAKLRAEEIPQEELVPSTEDFSQRVIQVSHFVRDAYMGQTVSNHGNPFLLLIHRGETLRQIKERVLKRLGLTEEETSKWKWALVSFGRPEYLQDDDIILSRDMMSNDYLGMEHPDTTARSHYRHIPEKPIKIYG